MTNFFSARNFVFSAALLGCGAEPISFSPEPPQVLPETPAPTASHSPGARINYPSDTYVARTPQNACVPNVGTQCGPIMQMIFDRDPFARDHAAAQRALAERYPVLGASHYLTMGAVAASGYRPRIDDVATFVEVGARGLDTYLVIAVNDPVGHYSDGTTGDINAAHTAYLVWYRLLNPRPSSQAAYVYTGNLQYVDWANDQGGNMFGQMPTAMLSQMPDTEQRPFQNASLAGNGCTPVNSIQAMAFIDDRLYVAGRGENARDESAIGNFAVGAFVFTATTYGYDRVSAAPAALNLCP